MRDADEPWSVLASRELDAEWARLRSQMDFAHGFWLGIVVVEADRPALELRSRMQAVVRSRAATFDVVAPQEPSQAVEAVLGAVLREPVAGAPCCTWVDLVRKDPDASRGPWRDAIVGVFQRMNERREAIRRLHPGGLVVAVPGGRIPDLRTHAPDLWAIRAIVLRAAAPPVTWTNFGERMERALPEPVQRPEFMADPAMLIHAASAPSSTPKDPGSRSRALSQAAVALARSGRLAEADRVSHEALAAAASVDGEERDACLADATWARSVVDVEDGDLGAARSRIEAAIRHRRAAERDVPPMWLEGLAGVLERLGDLKGAAENLEQALATERARVASHGESPERLRDLAISLTKIGRVQEDLGDLPAARRSFEESLALRRRLTDSLGESADRLLDLSISLQDVGRVQGGIGDLSGARSRLEESLVISRRLVETLPESPETARGLLVCLCQLGGVLRALGDLAGARSRFEESLELGRRLVVTLGESAERLRDLSICLNSLGRSLVATGDLSGARTRFEEALVLSRRVVESAGESPERLRNLSIVLTNVGGVQYALGDLPEARSSFEESLMLSRRLVESLGESPDRVRDLSFNLNQVGWVQTAFGDHLAAQSSFEESLALIRRLVELLGESPERLRDMWMILASVVQAASRSGARDSRWTELMDLTRRIAGSDWATDADREVARSLEVEFRNRSETLGSSPSDGGVESA